MINDPDPLPQVWVRPVTPEEYPDFTRRRARPVTRGDLDNQYHTVALRGFSYDRSPSEPPHRYRLINIGETLDLWTRDYDFGRVIWPMWPFLFAENWKEAIDEMAARNLYLFDIWAYCPSGPFERFEWSEYRVSDEMHRYILEKLGPRFLGYDNGEQDGRYIGAYARMVCPAPATRQEGYEAFRQYFCELGNDLQNYLVSLNSLTFPHYFARMDNHRLIGTESAQALPSVPMWYAFVRGAGKQYGLLWFGNASVWNRWGAKSLADPDAEDTNTPGFWSGPTAGTSMSLLRRLWYVLTMYGCVIMGYEAGHLENAIEEREANGQIQKIPALTEIGQEHRKAAEWCQKHPDRGEQHTPVAFLWDFYAGWSPPRHLYTKDPYLVWGNMPYEKGDYQIDLLFRELYPDYLDAGYYHSEQGFLTATPCGDIFDVLLSDAPEEVLNRYECIVLLGETRLDGDLLAKLARYVENGGQVVACANQLGAEAEPLFGVRCGEEIEAYHAIIPEHPWTVNESFFRMRRLEAGTDATVLARTRQGWPLAVRRQASGGGDTLLFAADFMLGNPTLKPELIHNEEDQPLPSPYALLEHVKAILLPYLRSFSLVAVEGPSVQFLVNVTGRADRLVVTLCNNSPQPWEGMVRPKRRRILKAIHWMSDEAMDGGDSLRVRVPPLDVAVIELLLDGEAFAARPERR
ncbi:MAG: hypothetical protein IT210_07340 [Armatimonadetes bacterium]|nr:hypothetical protein [Armatimonadota bacterium]